MRQTLGLPLLKNIVELDLSRIDINDTTYSFLGSSPSLTVLNLAKTKVSDHGIEQLFHLDHLKHLYLTHSEPTVNLLGKVESFSSLKKVYVFGTSLPIKGPKELHKGLMINHGGYTLLSNESDSIVS